MSFAALWLQRVNCELTSNKRHSGLPEPSINTIQQAVQVRGPRSMNPSEPHRVAILIILAIIAFAIGSIPYWGPMAWLGQ